MDVLILLIFVSLMLVVGALLFLLVRVRGGDFDHIDRLPFLPLEPDQRNDAESARRGPTRDEVPARPGAGPSGLDPAPSRKGEPS